MAKYGPGRLVDSALGLAAGSTAGIADALLNLPTIFDTAKEAVKTVQTQTVSTQLEIDLVKLSAALATSLNGEILTLNTAVYVEGLLAETALSEGLIVGGAVAVGVAAPILAGVAIATAGTYFVAHLGDIEDVIDAVQVIGVSGIIDLFRDDQLGAPSGKLNLQADTLTSLSQASTSSSLAYGNSLSATGMTLGSKAPEPAWRFDANTGEFTWLLSSTEPLQRALSQIGAKQFAVPLNIVADDSGQTIAGGPDGDTLIGGAGGDLLLSGGVESDWAGQAYRLYEATLGREPDAGGFDYWVGLLLQGMSVEHSADGFTSSPEFQAKYGALDDADFVTLLYNNVLHRAPDPGGEAYWLNLLEIGTTRAAVVAGFSESTEFKGNEKPGVEAYVQNVTPWHGNLLDGGAGTDTASYDAAMTGVTVDLGITGPQETFGAGIDTLVNIENLTGSSFDDKLTGDANPNVLSGGPGNDILDSSGGLEHDWAGETYRLYEATLARQPDPGGFDFWIGQLRGGMSLETAASGFTGSPEFQSTYGSLDDTQFVTLLYNNVLHRAPDPGGLSFWLNQISTGSRGATWCWASRRARRTRATSRRACRTTCIS